MHFCRTVLPKDQHVDLTGEDKLHFCRTELPEDYVDLTGDDKLQFYRTELPKDNVDLTGVYELHFYRKAEHPKIMSILQERINCIFTEQNSPKII